MKVRKNLIAVLLALVPAILVAQIPSGYVQTMATVPALAGGTFGAAWTNLSSSPQLGLLGCVSTFQNTVNGSIDSSGHFSTLLADTAQICPTPSTWAFTLSCPAASPGAFQIQVAVTGGGGTEDISSQITAALPAGICSGGGGGTLPIMKGGTGATTAAGAWTNIFTGAGIASNCTLLQNVSGTLTCTATTAAAALANLGGAALSGAAFTGPVSAPSISGCITNGAYVAGSSCYPTIQAAQTAAISAGGSVLIPAAYAGNDTVPTQNYSIVDLRNNILSSSHFFGCTYAIANAPGGLDCSFEADGAGDLWLAHNTHVNPATTTSMSLIAGSNLSVLVGSTTLFGNGGTAPLIVGRGTPNQETVAWTNWSVVDGTHLSIYTAKTHSGTTDIEQQG